MGLARHTAVAVVRLQPVPAQAQNPCLARDGSAAGASPSTGVDLWGSRLHADQGYANLSGQIGVCDSSGQNCKNLNQVNPPPITGGQGVTDTQCNASGNNKVVCDGSAPKYKVCPVYQTPPTPTSRAWTPSQVGKCDGTRPPAFASPTWTRSARTALGSGPAAPTPTPPRIASATSASPA